MAPVLVYIGEAIAAHAVAGGAMAAFGTFIATYATAIVTATMIVSSLAYSSAQQRKLKKALGDSQANAAIDQGRNVMVRDPISPWRLIYGQIPVSGPIFFWQISGSSNEYLNLGIVIARHECEELGTIQFEGVTVPLDGSGNATGTYAGYVRIKKFVGLVAGERDLTWESELPTVWTSTMVGKAVARLHIRLKYNPDLFTNGLPTITCLVKGKKVYDFRTGVTAWTPNVALCTADYLMDVNFGKGIAQARIRSADVIEAANVCDEAVVLNGGGTEARYTANGAMTADQDPDGVILDLAAAMAGHVSDPGGLWAIRAGAWRSPTLTLSDGDMVGTFSVVPRQSRQDTFNGVKGTYLSPINQWTPSDFPAINNDTYMGWDGGKRLWKDVVYNWTTSPSTAQRLAKIDLEAGRQQIVFTGDFTLKAMDCIAGDVIMLTRPRLGWSAKYFEVDRWDFKFMETDSGPALAIAVVGRETAAGIYNWADGEETAVDLAANTDFLNGRSVANVSGFSAAAASGTERTSQPRVKLSWTAPADDSITSNGYTELEYKKAAAATWVPWNKVRGDITAEFVTDLEVGTSYNFRARHINNLQVRSAAWVTATTTAPAGLGNYTTNLTNDRHGVACNAEGTALAGELGSGGRAFTDVQAYAGAVALSPVTSSPGAGQFSFTAAVISGTATITKVDDDTVRIDTLGSDTATIRVTTSVEGITTRDDDWVVWKVLSGGAYWLVSSAAAVNKSIGGAYTPTTVTFQALAKLAAPGPAAYSGRFKIDYWNGSSWVNDYTSGSNESSKTYTPPAGISKFRGQLYLAGSFSTFLDEEEIPITNDGSTGATGATGATGGTGPSGSNILGQTSGVGNASSTTWVDCCSISIAVPSGKTVIINVGGTFLNATAAIRSGYMRIMRDSTQVGSDFIAGNLPSLTGTAPATLNGSDTPGAGTFTYKVQVRTTGSGNDMYGYVDSLVLF